ncbi:MAG: ABC transporter permease [Bryobacteraceae bacterium]|jgi:ABC-2 type transport system permease protein
MKLVGHRLTALIRKEFNQIRRDKRLAISLIVPPTLQLLLFGFALNATVDDLRLGVVDLSHTPESRDLIANMTESRSFRLAGTYFTANQIGDAIARGDLDAGLIVPYDFARDLQRGRQSTVQVLLNAMNANTAAISQGYTEGVIQDWNRNLTQSGVHAQFSRIAAAEVSRRGQVTLIPAFLYNPGLVTSWFIVTGTFGVLLMLNGSLISSASMIKEREAGTVEQLLMTPAGTGEIIIAKIAPLFMLLCFMICLATCLIYFVFHVPIRGNLLLVETGAALCVLCGIGIGTFIATYTKSAQQAQLMSFFVNPPLASLSGALTPVEAMPHWMQPFTLINPIRHFGIITRSVLMKGSGIDTLWPNVLVLIAFTVVLLSLSVRRFRKQLG